MHIHRLIMVPHLRPQYRYIKAYLRHHQRTDPIHLILVPLHIKLHLFLRFYLTNHVQRNLKVVECSLRVLLQQVAIAELVADIHKNHGVLVDDLVFDLIFGVFELVDGVVNLAAVHYAFGVAGFSFYVVVDSEFENPILTRIQIRDLLQCSIVDLPPIIHLTNIIKHGLRFIIIPFSQQTLRIQLVYKQDVVLQIELAQISLLTQLLQEGRQIQVLVRALLHKADDAEVVAGLLVGLQQHVGV